MKRTSSSLTPLDRLTLIAISDILFRNVIFLFPIPGEDYSKNHLKVSATYKDTK